MRRPTFNIISVALIITLTVSFVTALPVRSSHDPSSPSDTEILQSKEWLWLNGNITALSDDAFKNDASWEGQKNALENKLKAVENQIEAGALNGAVNKLENDMKNSITSWITTDEAGFLKDLVDDLIDVIEGVRPPSPSAGFKLEADPDELIIEQGSSESSTIKVTSLRGFSERVDLSSTLAPETNKVTLTLVPVWVIPTPDGNTLVLTVDVDPDAEPDEYVITVTGTSGTKTDKVTIDLIITETPTSQEDTTPPTILNVQRFPISPPYNQSVSVTASVYDTGVPTPSGVKQVILNYSSGSTWTQVPMTLISGIYNASIPALPFDTSVEYRVYASDNNGNVAEPSILFSYKVTDPFLPLLRIDKPAQGAYLSGIVTITVFMKDQNGGGESGFASGELSINGTIVPLIPSSTNTFTYSWNTATFGSDGVYIIRLKARDNAGNVAEKTLTETVDNTLPTAAINTPAEGSYLRLSTLIEVTGSDINFDKMEVRIDDELVRTSFTSGSEFLEWNTRTRDDGVHSITLKVYDKAGNIKQALINVTTDNTAPVIGAPSWSPKEPPAKVDIQINATVHEPAYGSGVENVTLWYRNSTMEDWLFIEMELENGNWTTTLKDQSDTNVRFFVEAFDRAGNIASSDRLEFTVAGPAGFPLAWILAAIAVIGGGSGGTAYYLRRRRKKGGSTPSVAASPSKPAPPPEPTSLPVKKPPRRRSQPGLSNR